MPFTVVGQYTITGSPFAVTVAQSTSSFLNSVRLTNQSLTTLRVDWGNLSKILQPGIEDKFPVPDTPSNQIQITPIAYIAGPGTPTLTVEAAYAPDDFEGSYPISTGPGNVNIIGASGNVPVLNAPGTTLNTQQIEQVVWSRSAVSLANGQSVIDVVPIPAGCHSIALLANGIGPNLLATIAGASTGLNSINQVLIPSGVSFSSVAKGLWYPSIDINAKITILNQGSAAGGMSFWVVALLDPEIVDIADPVYTQGPTNSAPFTASMFNAGANTLLVAGIASRTIRLYNMTLFASGATFGKIWDGTTNYHEWVGGNGWQTKDFGGMSLPVGNSLRVTNDSAVNATSVAGSISYSQ